MKGSPRRAQMIRSRKRQAGAEMVEFTLTLLLWFITFFVIFELAIVMYDKGAVLNATRVGARQASLYWVDPDGYEKDDPLANTSLKTAMVATAVDYWVDHDHPHGGLVINPGNDGVEKSVWIIREGIWTEIYHHDGESTVKDCVLVNGDQSGSCDLDMNGVTAQVSLSYPHHFIGLAHLLFGDGGSPQVTLGSAMGANTEKE